MRILFVYKNNPQDAMQSAFIKWLPRFKKVAFFCFRHYERKRFDPYNLEISELFKNMLEHYRPTHIINYVGYLNHAEIEVCKSKGIFVSMIINGFSTFSTGLHRDQGLFIDTLRLLDAYLIPHRPHLNKLLELGVKAYELPFFCDPDIFKPIPAYQRIWDWKSPEFFFLGNIGKNSQTEYREEVLLSIAENHKVLTCCDFRLKHRNIDYFHPIKSLKIQNWLANRALINISFDYFPGINDYANFNPKNVLVPYDFDYSYAIRQRLFFLTATGRPVIIEKHPEVERFFKNDIDIIMWSTIEELISKSAHYTNNPQELIQIGDNALKTNLNNHTAELRLNQMLFPILEQKSINHEWAS
jgi:spore maturation protein CgeB